jgi:cell shape-determining protein MreC
VVRVGAGNIYKEIIVKPAVDLSRLEMVLVVVKPTTAQQQAMNTPARP